MILDDGRARRHDLARRARRALDRELDWQARISHSLNDAVVVAHAPAVDANDHVGAAEVLRGGAAAVGHLRERPGLVRAAGRRESPDAVAHASAALRDDKKTAAALIKADWRCLAHLSDARKADKRIVEPALKASSDALEFTPLSNDKKLVLGVVKKDGLALRHASDALRASKEIVLAAVKQNVEALKYVSDTDILFADKDICDAAKKKGVLLQDDDA